MNLTINTDASFSPHHRVGGYAFYIVCNLFKITKGGQFKNVEPLTPIEAEVMCIGNAFATLLAQKELPQVNYIVVNCDCLWGMNNIKTGNGIYKQVRELQKKLILRTGATYFEYRHVKAHNNAPDKRSWVNEWCDTEAKKWMRKKVAEIKRKNLVVRNK